MSTSLRNVNRRRRLTPEVRRDQLLDIGAEEFATRAYQEVLMAEIADRAGVSRALIYRHFPTKRDLFAAIYQRASDRLLEITSIRPDLPLAEQVVAGLEAHFDFFVANARTVVEANRGALAGDPVIQDIINSELASLRQGLLDAASLRGHDRAVASTALHGWLAFVRVVCVDWLSDNKLARREVRDMCLRTLVSALGASMDLTSPPRSAT
jgi:AcrR family transcriptional regulator